MSFIDNIILGILECYGTNNPYEILEDMGVKIKELSYNSPVLKDNNSIFIDVINTVFIRDDLPTNCRLFYLRHELGHILMHLDINNIGIPNTYKLENQADYFALKLGNITLDEVQMYEMTIEQIASSLELPVRALKQLV